MLRPLLECWLARKLKHGILWLDCKWLAMHLGYEIVNLAPKLAVRRDWKCCFNDTGDWIGGVRFVRFEIRGEESGTAQHCFFKLSRAFVGQEESHEQVQVCASVLSFFADVCHGHVVMAPKSIIQQSKNLRTSIQIQEFLQKTPFWGFFLWIAQCRVRPASCSRFTQHLGNKTALDRSDRHTRGFHAGFTKATPRPMQGNPS